MEFGQHLYGGAAQVRYLIKGLSDCGIENILVCPLNSEIAKVTCATEVVELSIGGDLDLRLPIRLKNLISLYDPSVVHAHSRRGADTVGGWTSRFMGVPATAGVGCNNFTKSNIFSPFSNTPEMGVFKC